MRWRGAAARSDVAGRLRPAGETRDAGEASYRPQAIGNDGEGAYNVYVIKTAYAGSNYTLENDCMTGNNGAGLNTGTTLVRT